MKNNKQIINTNIRLNLENEPDRKAWEYLQSMDRKKYKSYTMAVVTALNFYFDRQTHIEADPYLETREKEETFLQRVIDTIKQALTETSDIGNLVNLLKLMSQNQQQLPQNCENTADDNNAALDFADSF